MDPASTIGPKVRNFLSNEDTSGLAPRFFIYGAITAAVTRIGICCGSA
jgi:hypothetical protein